jgi:hypothetical protein
MKTLHDPLTWHEYCTLRQLSLVEFRTLPKSEAASAARLCKGKAPMVERRKLHPGDRCQWRLTRDGALRFIWERGHRS